MFGSYQTFRDAQCGEIYQYNPGQQPYNITRFASLNPSLYKPYFNTQATGNAQRISYNGNTAPVPPPLLSGRGTYSNCPCHLKANSGSSGVQHFSYALPSRASEPGPSPSPANRKPGTCSTYSRTSSTENFYNSNPFTQVARISDHLYLSSSHTLQASRLHSLKIRLVVNATVEVPLVNIPGILCIRVPVFDRPGSTLSDYFDSVSDRIFAEYKRGGTSLIHCVAGVSRSCALVLAYLVKYSNMNLREAYIFVKSRRSCVRPNLGFWKQLIDYEFQLTGHRTVNIVQRSGMAYPDVYPASERLNGWC